MMCEIVVTQCAYRMLHALVCNTNSAIGGSPNNSLCRQLS
jgi:hypothetical protein